MEKDFSTLVSVSGLPGLYRVVANRHNGLIIEDLTNGQKRFAPVRSHQFSLLASIGIYTEEGTEDLQNVFLAMDAHSTPAPDVSVAKDEELRQYFREILPNYDEEMVRMGDIRKVIKWFHFIKENDIMPEATTSEAGPDTKETTSTEEE